MGITEQAVRSIFAGLEQGHGDDFFAHVAEDADWTVMGTHPLAGDYPGKAQFKAGTFQKLHKVLPDGAQLRVTNVLVAGDWAVVELVSGATARNGMLFDNHYCWLVRFEGGSIVEVRAYLDSVKVVELFRQNPI
ncbi:MAG: nuclear transport factor 2 family protein [Hyphomicrobiales bacterium]|nr:nuclear transport factor 2 family protein [Hyphomicrobiales bacterium]